jgi:hypothetical protein
VKQAPRLAGWRWSRALAVTSVVGALSIMAAEILARVDDWVERSIPLLASPTYESELRIFRDGIFQGRPHGHYKKWKLNAWGFRGPEIALAKRSGCTRVLALGASEIFGLYESSGRDFSAALLTRLSAQGCYEVINAAMPGLTLGSARSYWDIKLAAFRPDVVVIYPTPDMSINDADRADPAGVTVGSQPRRPQAVQATPVRLRSRLFDRLSEFVHTPAVIDDWRIRRALAAQLRAHPANWVQHEPPPADLALFNAELDALVVDVATSGTTVMLMTHADRVTADTLAEHSHDALWMQSAIPNVTPAAQLAFTTLANRHIRTVASVRKLPLIDLDRILSGCLECFVDGAHFTDRGAELAAAAAATAIRDHQPGRR